MSAESVKTSLFYPALFWRHWNYSLCPKSYKEICAQPFISYGMTAGLGLFSIWLKLKYSVK